MQQFTILINDIPVLVTRKPVKNMYLRVRPGTGARLTAPAGLGIDKIQEFARLHGEWLAEAISIVRENDRQDTPNIPAIQNIWGVGRRVRIETGGKSWRLYLAGEELRLSVPDIPDSRKWEGILSGFLRKEVQDAAPALLETWCARLNLPVPAFGIRRMTRRWGTCYPAKRRIMLNSEIAAYPAQCLEQVIVHELLHFFEPNHGIKFRQLMDSFLPEWKKAATLLR